MESPCVFEFGNIGFGIQRPDQLEWLWVRYFLKFLINQIAYMYNILRSQSSIMLIFVLIYMQEKVKLIVTL